MNQKFRVILIGGTGQVGGAVVQALLAEPACAGIVMVTRKPVDVADSARVRNVVLDTGAADFEARVIDLAHVTLASGDRVAAASCVGVGSGSLNWTEEQLKALEVGVVGAFARGVREAGVAQFCLLSAVGSSVNSRIKFARVMGMKQDAVLAVKFPRTAIFQPGIIVGNKHTPAYVAWLGKLVPGPWGNIEQLDIGRAFAAEISRNGAETGVAFYENKDMRGLITPAPH